MSKYIRKIKNVSIIFLILSLMLQIFTPINECIFAATNGDEVLLTLGNVKITKSTTIAQITAAYGEDPIVKTPSAFGGHAYTYCKGNYENVLYVETNSDEKIVSYGALSDDFTSTWYSAGDKESGTYASMDGIVANIGYIDKKVAGIITYVDDIKTTQTRKMFLEEYLSDKETYKKYMMQHSIIMLNYFLKKNGYPLAEYNEDIFDSLSKIVENGKTIKTYAEENNKELYYKVANNSYDADALIADLPNPLRAVSAAINFSPTDYLKYAYLDYDVFKKDDGNYVGGSNGFYVSSDFLKDFSNNVTFTSDEKSKIDEIEKTLIDSVNTYNQGGIDEYIQEPDYSTSALVAGKIKENKLVGAVGYINAIRVGAGLPKLTHNVNMSNSAQHKATLLTYYLKTLKKLVSNPHYPGRPTGVSSEYYDEAQKYMTENVYSGDLITSISNAINDASGDPYEAGHRYNLLNPAATTMGIGVTEGQAVHKFATGGSYSVDAVAWPSIGVTPLSTYSPANWSFKFYKNYSITNSTSVHVKCLNNNLEWDFPNQTEKGQNQLRIYTGSNMVSFVNPDMVKVANGYVYEITIKNVKNNSTNATQDYKYRAVIKSIGQDSETKVFPTSVKLDKTSVKAVVNSKFELKTTFPNSPTEVKTTWTTSNPNVAKVDQFGQVTIVGTGNANITVETLNGQKAICAVNGVSAPSNLKLENSTYVIKMSKSLRQESVAKLKVIDTSGIVINEKEIVWKLQDSSIAKVSNGYLQSLSVGQTTLTGTYKGKNVTANVIVVPGTNYPPRYKLSTETYQRLDAKDTVVVTWKQASTDELVAISNMYGDLTYDASNLEVVKIEPLFNGIKGVKTSDGIIHFTYDVQDDNLVDFKGDLANITFKVKDDCTYKENKFGMTNIKNLYLGDSDYIDGICQYIASVKTYNAIKEITLSQNSYKFTNVNQKLNLTATINPSENIKNSTITWSTNNKNVADVDKNGVVTSKGSGNAVITATTANGKTAKCNVTVEYDALKGDYNLNGTVEVVDAYMLLVDCANNVKVTGKKLLAGDMNNDNSISVLDAYNLLNFLAHK